MNASLPLFPLNTVLFPDGILTLRVFETRYLDMVRRCAGENSEFGVCSIIDGQETGQPATPALIGTRARISDFFNADNGLLGIRATGGQRFRILTTRTEHDGLITAHAEDLPPPPDSLLSDEYLLLRQILERIYSQLEGPGLMPEMTPQCLQSANWVSYRLAEALPLPMEEKQALLELDQADLRLQYLLNALATLQQQSDDADGDA